MPVHTRHGLILEFVLLAREITQVGQKLVRIRRYKRRGQIVITFTRPRLKTPAKIRKHLTAYAPLFSQAFTAILLTLGVGGIMYSLGPVVFMRETASAESSMIITPPAVEEKKPVGLPRSAPTRLEAPDISLSTELIKLGKNDDGTLATPERYDVAGWYEFAPTPGEIGPAIIVGHVDNYMGAAIFYHLKELQPGQIVQITREDQKIVKFKVDKVELFDQSNFPTDAVYGNLDYPGLRLITCGGSYNPLTGRYTHNTVVYASKT